MTSKIDALSRQSPEDLKITFEHNGDAISVYLPVAGKSDEELKMLSGNYIKCALCCSQKKGFVACMARCLYDGQCCDGGLRNCSAT
jgi:hypothetical protein